ncbi:MAG: glycosyltransferase family 2 protein [Rhodospirillaceae bacterium]|nr:glycosyltransferase family 2 protein [Rhodospirillaceae bacterium]
MTVSIVIPAFNEGPSVAGTVRQALAALSAAGIVGGEVLVVDDGSSDDTAAQAEAAGARVTRHPHNIGYGRAIKTGMEVAANDTIVITDADGTYPIAEIPALLAQYRRGFDMVVGERTGSHYRESWIKWPLRIALRRLVEHVAGRPIPDINSGLRVFSRTTTRPFLIHLSDGFSFTTSITLAYMINGRFVHYHPIAYGERSGTTKVRLLKDSWRTVKVILKTALYHSPMTIFFALSAGCVLLAAISIAIGIVFKMATGFMMGVASILAAIFVFCLGLLSDLLRQILKK